MARLFARENWLLLLLIFVPIALVLEHVVHAGALAVFLTSAAAIIPLAVWDAPPSSTPSGWGREWAGC